MRNSLYLGWLLLAALSISGCLALPMIRSGAPRERERLHAELARDDMPMPGALVHLADETEEAGERHFLPLRQSLSLAAQDPLQESDNSPQFRLLRDRMRAYLQQGAAQLVPVRVPPRDVGHRLTDRDYIGWMDFGKRSAMDEEYYS
ncbi:cholecystokinin [Petromyzon marinus]|uniref:cholecystokinin n=1 Tax=Petromyzon marinus TaxID=7757 RepID=UPI003F6E7DF5